MRKGQSRIKGELKVLTCIVICVIELRGFQ